MDLNYEALKEIATQKTFEELVGEFENRFFDCKQILALENTKDDIELAKDVSSFANAEGGFLFIGVATEAVLTADGDRVVSANGSPKDKVSKVDKVRKLVDSLVYPTVSGLEVTYHSTNIEKDLGILVIEIPKQTSGKPFIVVKADIEGQKGNHTGMMFNYFERKGDVSSSLRVERLQVLLNKGLNYEMILEQKLDLLTSLAQGRQLEEKKEKMVESLEERVQKTLSYADFKTRRRIELIAYPKHLGDDKEMEGFYAYDSGGVRILLEQPPAQRTRGWDLRTLDRAQLIDGDFLRVAVRETKVIDLYPDGLLVLCASVGEDFLAHASPETQHRINPNALIELVCNFVYFYEVLITKMKAPPEEMTFEVRFGGLHEGGEISYLVPSLYNNGLSFERSNAPIDSFKVKTTVKTKDLAVGKTAYSLIRDIYARFQFSKDRIPYVKNEGEIDLELLGWVLDG